MLDRPSPPSRLPPAGHTEEVWGPAVETWTNRIASGTTSPPSLTIWKSSVFVRSARPGPATEPFRPGGRTGTASYGQRGVDTSADASARPARIGEARSMELPSTNRPPGVLSMTHRLVINPALPSAEKPPGGRVQRSTRCCRHLEVLRRGPTSQALWEPAERTGRRTSDRPPPVRMPFLGLGCVSHVQRRPPPPSSRGLPAQVLRTRPGYVVDPRKLLGLQHLKEGAVVQPDQQRYRERSTRRSEHDRVNRRRDMVPTNTHHFASEYPTVVIACVGYFPNCGRPG